MKIILSLKEGMALKNIAEKAENGSFDTILEKVKNSKFVSYKNKGHEIEITFDGNYTSDLLVIFGKYIGLFISQVRATFETIQAFQEDTDNLLEKYTANDKEADNNGKQE